MQHFYPRSPCGERHLCYNKYNIRDTFLSTLSLRRATAYWYSYATTPAISIHALLAESDQADAGQIFPGSHFYPRSPCGERRRPCRIFYSVVYFYPRSPCGERPLSLAFPTLVCRFLSTLSLRRATEYLIRTYTNEGISIHALLAESDMRR